jgi:hypothetical protein
MTPIIAFMVILDYSNQIHTPDFISNFNTLYEEFGTDIYSSIFNVIFLIRRFIYAVCLILLSSSPYFQLLINSLSAFIPFIYIIVYRPYKERADNILNGITEGFTFLQMTLMFILLGDLSENQEFYLDWFIVLCLYASFLIPVAFQTVMTIKKFLGKVMESCRKDKPKEIEINTEAKLASITK